MYDLHSKFEEDRTKTTVAIMDDRYFGQTDTRTDRHTDRHTRKVILYLSNAMLYTGQTKTEYCVMM